MATQSGQITRSGAVFRSGSRSGWGGLVVELAHGLPAAVTQHAINDQHGGALPSGLGRVRLSTGRLGLLLGTMRGSRLGGLAFRVHRLDMNSQVVTFLLTSTRHFEGDADRFEQGKLGARGEHLICNVGRHIHAHNGQAVFGDAIWLIAVKHLDDFTSVPFWLNASF